MTKRALYFWGSIIIAILLGSLMPLSFSPFGYGFLAPILLAFWLLLILPGSCKRAFWLSLLFGVSFFTVGVWWIRISLLEFGGAPLLLGVFLTLLLALYLGLYYALLGYFTLKTQLSLPFRLGILFPVMGVLFEYIRAQLLTGFPWLSLGYTLTDYPLALWLFPEMGALMASFWVYWLAGLLTLLLLQIMAYRGKEPGNASQKKLKAYLPALFMAMMLILIIAGTSTLLSDKISPKGEPLKVALIQGNIAQELKFSEAQYYEILATYYQLTAQVASNVDLIIWPETAIPALYEQEVTLGEALRKISQEERATVMTGIFSGQGSVIRNSVVAYSDQLRSRDQRYDKVHLVPFGEFLPFRSLLDLLSGMIEIPFSDLTAGREEQSPFLIHYEVDGVPAITQLSTFICYEAVFGDELRYLGKQSDFLVNVSNDAWFGDSIGPWQHFQITRARAIELQREMVRATNNGITALIDRRGEVKAILPQFEQGVLEVEVMPYEGTTTYSRVGDLSWLLLLWVVAGLGALFFRRELKK
ncbi:apolipoprotein N-acyltransferase [Ignatzschineria sp. F8392]|uniref:apolipoprotein N-acyltransferase n=1 Tax=Ignatzschineria sp. F8392 TaxID=1980117 RepID=UPI0013033FD8|nr:apolipoprotein N-acyltransferase [Ignatzschineria sp. F8392]